MPELDVVGVTVVTWVVVPGEGPASVDVETAVCVDVGSNHVVAPDCE